MKWFLYPSTSSKAVLSIFKQYGYTGLGMLAVILEDAKNSQNYDFDDFRLSKCLKIHMKKASQIKPFVSDVLESARQKKTALPPIKKKQAPEPTKVKTACRLNEDWYPDQDLIDWCNGKYPLVDQSHQTELFKNHHISKGNRMIDWRRAWQNWMHNAGKGKYGNAAQSRLRIVPPEKRAGGEISWD